MAFRGKDPVMSKIVIKKVIEQINTYNYLGCLLSCEKDDDVPNKLIKFVQITGIAKF
jgi:hypothetical protein